MQFRAGHTYAGNPVACAVGLAAASELLERDLIGNARRMSTLLKDRLPIRRAACLAHQAQPEGNAHASCRDGAVTPTSACASRLTPASARTASIALNGESLVLDAPRFSTLRTAT